MKILELNIREFGCLKNTRITPDSRLTIIEGDNESGKSMIMEFVLFMLYGLPRRGVGAEAERGISRDGHRAAGSMRFVCGEREYTVERQITEGTGRRGALRVVDMTDGQELSLAVEPGEHFLGVPREVYVGSCSIGQLQSSAVSGKKESSAIGNLLSGGDETVNVGDAEKKLESIRVGYRHKTGRGGALVEQSERVAALQRELEAAKENYARVNLLEAEERRLVTTLSELAEKQTEAARTLEQISLRFTLRQFEELHRVEAQRAELAQERDGLCRRELLTEEMPESNRPHGLRQCADELDRWDRLLRENSARLREERTENASEVALGVLLEQNGGAAAERSRLKRGAILRTAGACALAVGCALNISAAFLSYWWIYVGVIALMAVAIALMTAGFATVIRFKKTYGISHRGAALQRWEAALNESRAAAHAEEALRAEQRIAEERRAEAEEELRALLRRTLPDGTPTAEAARAEADRLAAFLSAYDSYGEQLRVMDGQLTAQRERLSGFSEAELRREVGDVSVEIGKEELDRARTEKRFYAEQEGALQRRLQDCRTELISRRSFTASPTELSDRLAEAERSRETMEDYYESVVMALEALSEASEALRGNVSPVLGRTASELMEYVSGGSYGRLMTGGKSMNPSLCGSDGLPTPSELLSGGTRDAAYLCLRIALMMQLFPEELPPLLMDESLCQMDGVRVGRVLSLLSGLCGKGMQCILFTCHTREGELCRELRLNHTAIRLSRDGAK